MARGKPPGPEWGKVNQANSHQPMLSTGLANAERKAVSISSRLASGATSLMVRASPSILFQSSASMPAGVCCCTLTKMSRGNSS
jgi:hypothetical protein